MEQEPGLARQCHPIQRIDFFYKIGYDSYCYIRGTSTLVKFSEGMELDGYLLNMIAARPESLSRLDGLVPFTRRLVCSGMLSFYGPRWVC